MARTRVIQNNFTSGEFSPDMHDRTDFVKHKNALKTLENCLVKPQGGIIRRPGTRFVAHTPDALGNRLVRFVFSADQAYVLEFSYALIRFYRNGGQLVSGGSPVTVGTPWTAAELNDLQFAQEQDVVYIAHPDHPVYKLRRLADTEWDLVAVQFKPQPSDERGFFPSATLTPSATTGSITLTASAASFLPSYVDRVVEADQASAIITAYASPVSVTATVLSAFPSTSTIADGDWKIIGSPVCSIITDKVGPVGALVTVNAFDPKSQSSNLILNGTFTTNLTSWTDRSGGEISTGTHDGAGNSPDLIDTTEDFLTAGVEVGMSIENTTDGSSGVVTDIFTTTNPNDSLECTLSGGTDNDWDAGDAYIIYRTGSAIASGGKARLAGGPNGYGWIEQSVAVTQGNRYRLEFDVSDQSLSAMVGTSVRGSENVAELTYEIGNDRFVDFEADAATIYVAFRTNQDVTAAVDNVTLRDLTVNAFRTADVGKIIKMNNGIIELTSLTSNSRVVGIVRKILDATDDLENEEFSEALAGAWNLEDPVWSSSLGYPRSVTLFGGRLYLQGTATYPQRVWASKVADLENFSAGAEDNDSLEFDPRATDASPSVWILGDRNIVIGTESEEFRATGSLGGTLTPASIQVISPSHYGSENNQPIRIRRRIVFIQRGGKRIVELLTNEQDVPSEGPLDNDLTLLAEHIGTVGIRRLAYQQEPRPTLWAVLNDNTLASFTYLREHDIYGWARHPMSGLVKDVCVIPHPDGDRDQVWLIVDWQVTGTNPSVCYLADTGGFYGATYLDAHLTYSGAATTTLTGLSHLNGKTVGVLGNGSVQTDKVVSAGSITLDEEVTQAEVGLAYTSQFVTLRPSDARQGAVSLTGLKNSITKLVINVLSSGEFLVNSRTVAFRDGNDLMDTPVPLFTGDVNVATTGWSSESPITVSQDLPLPLNVRYLARSVEVEDV